MSTRAAKKKAPTGAGRPPLNGDEAMKTGTFRRTQAQADKLERLGGSEWIRKKIDAAKDPADK